MRLRVMQCAFVERSMKTSGVFGCVGLRSTLEIDLCWFMQTLASFILDVVVRVGRFGSIQKHLAICQLCDGDIVRVKKIRIFYH